MAEHGPGARRDALPDLWDLSQVQPRNAMNWAADGRWVKVPDAFLPPGDARRHGWSRGLRITRPEGWRRRLRDYNERMAPLMATYANEPNWFNYLTVPLMVPVTDMRGRTVTFTCRTYLPLTGLAFAHYLTRSRGFKRRFGVFDEARVTFSNKEGDVVPLLLTHPNSTGGTMHSHNGSARYHVVGLNIAYSPLPGGWIEEDAPDSGGTSDESVTPPRVRRRSRSRSARSLTYDGDNQPRHRAAGRTVSVSP